MGHLEVAHVEHVLPDGRTLLDDVSFRVPEGSATALVGPNGSGKTTLLRLLSGDLVPQAGSVTVTGGLGVMRQFVGSVRDETTVRDLLVSVAPPRLRDAARAVDAAELAIMEVDDEPAQLAYAQALADWAEAQGYEAETLWDVCTVAALGVPYEQARWREVRTLSGGEQKRLVLEALLRGPDEVLLLDEPDNYLDVPGKRWLEDQLRATRKTVLFVSHDRELLARVEHDRTFLARRPAVLTHAQQPPVRHVQIAVPDAPGGVRRQSMRGPAGNDLPQSLVRGIDEVDDLARRVERPCGSPVFVDGGADVELCGKDLLLEPRMSEGGPDQAGSGILRGDLRREVDVLTAEGGVEDRRGACGHLRGAQR